MEEMRVWAICWKTEDLVLVQVKFGNMHKMRCPMQELPCCIVNFCCWKQACIKTGVRPVACVAQLSHDLCKLAVRS